jgi:hypothetical protein
MIRTEELIKKYVKISPFILFVGAVLIWTSPRIVWIREIGILFLLIGGYGVFMFIDRKHKQFCKAKDGYVYG